MIIYPYFFYFISLVVNLYIIITINARLEPRTVVFCTYDNKSSPHIAAIMTGDSLSST